MAVLHYACGMQVISVRTFSSFVFSLPVCVRSLGRVWISLVNRKPLGTEGDVEIESERKGRGWGRGDGGGGPTAVPFFLFDGHGM